MTERPYSEILQELDRLEDPYDLEKHDLLALGITAAHIPDPIETILTDRYYLDEAEESLAHIFAYIALGQLKTEAAIDGLILGVQKWSSFEKSSESPNQNSRGAAAFHEKYRTGIESRAWKSWGENQTECW